jgi:CDP-paratose 2-epimerase
MSVVVITGSGGLVGAEAARTFAVRGYTVVGIDNDTRGAILGSDASTQWCVERLATDLGPSYIHKDVDVRDVSALLEIFRLYGSAIDVVIHTAGQPSHDMSAMMPYSDFQINAGGTLSMLEATRGFAHGATFVYLSTNKVYGDHPNRLPFDEKETRWEVVPGHKYANGIDEAMSLDQSMHSPFGVSKLYGDLITQEYGRYFGMNTVCFRCGCITGPAHSGTQMHGFLSYLMKCAVTEAPYIVFGYKGKQVRDNLHCADLVEAIWQFVRNPRRGAVYNMGGSQLSQCSVLEAINMCEQRTGREMLWTYSEQARAGDHKWWISDVSNFKLDYPDWCITHGIADIMCQLYEAGVERWI